MLIDAQIILASGSPRRAELLAQIGVSFEKRVSAIDESPREGERPEDYVQRLALEKAQATINQHGQDDSRPVLAADTSVVLDGTIFGKPRNEADFGSMLRQLSGKTHEVFTAFALISPNFGVSADLSRSRVTFRTLSDDDISQYWASGEPIGKAGGYAIQGLAAQFVTHIEGSYSGIVGLPLALVAAHLEQHLTHTD